MNVLYNFLSKQCTFSPPSCCSHSKAENTRQVRDYMEKNAKNGSWINCHYNRLNHTEVTAALGNYKLSIFMALFWPLSLIVIGFSFTKYLKKITPQSGTKIKRDDTRRMLILSTMTAFLNTDGRPAAHLLGTHSGPGARKNRQFTQTPLRRSRSIEV